MGILSEVKCARCDRKYSGVRSRCPYCGARRIGRGKYSPESDDSRGKMMVGILIMVALVAAVSVLLVTAEKGAEPDPGDVIESQSPPPTQNLPDDTGVSSVEDTPIETPPETPDEPETPSPPVVESVTITYNGSARTDITMNMTDAPLTLGVKIVPADTEADIVWQSSDTSVFEAVPTDTTGSKVKITPIGPGDNKKLTVTVGDVTAECIIRVRR